jgi:hypothetical protein
MPLTLSTQKLLNGSGQILTYKGLIKTKQKIQAHPQRYVHTHTEGLQWPKRLFSGLWQRSSRLDPIRVHVGFMVDKVESLEMQCWRRMEKFCWTDRVRNEEVLPRFKERNAPHKIKMRNAYWIGYILHRNCLLKHVIKGKNRGKDISDRKTRKKT